MDLERDDEITLPVSAAESGSPENLSPDQQRLFEAFRKLPKAVREELIAHARGVGDDGIDAELILDALAAQKSKSKEGKPVSGLKIAVIIGGDPDGMLSGD